MGNIMSASFAPECTDAKRKYDDCFNQWYSERKSISNECEEFWQDYQDCVNRALEKKGIKPMLDDARKDAPFESGGKLNSADEAPQSKS